ncbi:MAG TPA: hypothetical protein VI757_06260 [Bacteroidia bacterium]|nr:hypothetical protein [Bacteroidia bacterium]
MTNSEAIQFERTTEKHLSAVSQFISLQTGNEKATPSYLQWWFLKNSVSCSLQHVELNGNIAGIAATNNFRINFQGAQHLVAMPQKVLTDSRLRGQGLFSKLYLKTEEENLKVNHVDFFLTFTNEASTPVFLRKLGYKKGISPDVFLIFPGISNLFSRKKYEVTSNLEQRDDYRFSATGFNNSFIKDDIYFKWRYFSFEDDIVMITHRHEHKPEAIFLKRVVKSKIPFYAVLDIVSESEESASLLIRYALNYSVRNFSAGLMALNHQRVEPVFKKFIRYRVRSRFHFLVKGKNETETESLAQTKFNFTFGDLDFI